jgi:hypothetical protein
MGVAGDLGVARPQRKAVRRSHGDTGTGAGTAAHRRQRASAAEHQRRVTEDY